MMKQTEELLQVLGIDKARVRLEWISSAEGPKFAATAREFTEQVRALGPSMARAA